MPTTLPPSRPMRRADLPAVGRVLAQAFADDPFYAVLFSERETRTRMLAPYFERSASSALALNAAYVAETRERGVAGAALWAPPAAAETGTTPATQDRALADLFGAETFATYATVMDHLRTHRLGSLASPHWYVNLVGVDPSARGRGLGRSLLQPMLERADREGRITALETFSEANLPLYARFGFGVRHAGCEPRTGLRWWLLTRPTQLDEPPPGT